MKDSIRDGLAELARQGMELSRTKALVGLFMSVVVLGFAAAAFLTRPNDVLNLGAVVVLIWVGLTGVGITVYRLLH